MTVNLHEYERAVLPVLLESTDIDVLIEKTGLTQVQISRALQWLENKELITLTYEKSQIISLGENGLVFLEKGLPEKRVLKELQSGKKAMDEFTSVSSQEVTAVIGLLKKEQVVTLQKDTTSQKLVLELTQKASEFSNSPTPLEIFLQSSFPKNVESLSQTEQDVLLESKTRKDVFVIETIQKPRIMLTDSGKELAKSDLSTTEAIGVLTSEMITTQSYQGKSFRPFDVTARVPSVWAGRIHPMSAVIDVVKQIFLEMGFSEMTGPWVETSFWCMDSMWIPQDHPARDAQDTFYLQKKGTLPSKKIVDAVRKVHEQGADTGFKGYEYKWDPELAKELILRTHTTATTYRMFGKGIQSPSKYFYVGKVFRNEAVDATHLAEFHQVEGFVVAPGLTLQHLLGFIKEFYSKLGYTDIIFKPTYNPYTEPSIEALYYDPQRKQYIELINSGIFRPESLEPYGITDPVIAWGLGLERLAMILHKQDKLKDLVGPQTSLKWLREYKW